MSKSVGKGKKAVDTSDEKDVYYSLVGKSDNKQKIIKF